MAVVAPSRYGKRALRLMLMRWLKGQRWVRPLYRARRRRVQHTRWQRWVQAPLAPHASPTQRVLIATSTGGQLAVSAMEQLLGAALHTRAAAVEFLLCDGVLPACMLCEHTLMRREHDTPQAVLCEGCFAPAAQAIEPLGLKLWRYGEWLTPEDHAEITARVSALRKEDLMKHVEEGIPLGEHAHAAACRFFGTDAPLAMQHGKVWVRRYLVAAWLTMRVAERLFAAHRPDVVVMHHGIYVPQGVIADVAKKHGIRLVAWHPAYRKGTFIFSHADTYHRTMIVEPTERWEHMPWNAEKEQQTMEYLASRHTGRADWIWFHENPEFDRESIVRALKLDMNKPIIGLLTNVVWDAQLHYPNNAYPTMIGWLKDSIEHFRTRTDVQLLIRVHPAEVYGSVPTAQPVVELIRARFPNLPDHIKIIPPLSGISTYSAMALCDSVLVYSTKMAVELATTGMPVVVAGDAWVRGKDFSWDAKDPVDYRMVLAKLPLRTRLSEAQVQRARRYAHHFFFRRMITVNALKPQAGWPPFAVDLPSLEALAPGVCKGLDVICNGVLEGTPFEVG